MSGCARRYALTCPLRIACQAAACAQAFGTRAWRQLARGVPSQGPNTTDRVAMEAVTGFVTCTWSAAERVRLLSDLRLTKAQHRWGGPSGNLNACCAYVSESARVVGAAASTHGSVNTR